MLNDNHMFLGYRNLDFGSQKYTLNIIVELITEIQTKTPLRAYHLLYDFISNHRVHIIHGLQHDTSLSQGKSILSMKSTEN